jgi:formate-nitrite transporter family protein
MAVGVFAFFIVKEETNSDLAATLAFAIGFIAVTLASSELFTENYLVPLAAVIARIGWRSTRAPTAGSPRLEDVTG